MEVEAIRWKGLSFPMPWRLFFLNGLMFFSSVVFYADALDAVAFSDIYTTNFLFMTAVSLGIISFGLTYQKFSPPRWQCLLYWLLTGHVLSTLLIALYPFLSLGKAAILIGLMVFLLTFGYLSGFIYYQAARWVPGNMQGRYIGGFIALANALLFLYEEAAVHLETAPALLLHLAAIGVILWLFLRPKPWGAVERPLAPHPLVLGHWPLCVAVAVTLSLLMGLDDAVSMIYYESYRELFAPSRLAVALGFLLAGVLADWRPAYLPLTALLGKTVTMAAFASALEGDSLVAKSYAESVFSAFLIVFLLRLFLEIAVRSRRPAFWAGMGRAIEMPFCAIGTIVGENLVSRSSPLAALLVYAVLLVLVAALFYRGLMLYYSAVRPVPADSPAPTATPAPVAAETPVLKPASPPDKTAAGIAPPLAPLELQEETLRHYQGNYQLTPREVDVLRAILTGRSIAEIAEELHITQRTVKYHIGNLLRKTGTKNQWELRRFLNMNTSVHTEDKL